MTNGPVDDLFPDARNPEGTLIINDRCLVKTQGDQRAVIVCGVVVAQYKLSDDMAEAYALVNLVEQGWADQNDVARAFGRSTRTVRRYEQRFAEGGLAALGQPRGYPKGRARLPRARTDLIRQWKGKGRSNRDIAQHLGVSEMAVRKWLRRIGWEEPVPDLSLFPPGQETPANPKLSAFSNPAIPLPSAQPTPGAVPKVSVPDATAAVPWTIDTDPSDRSGDRLMAYLGLLEDAAPLFGSRAEVPGAGVLLALPPLVHSGVFDRGGFSPKLFKQIIDAGMDLLTYRKGRFRRVLRKLFLPQSAEVEGRRVTYLLADQEVRLLKGKLRLRQVTRLAEDGHQTPILTNRRDLSAGRVAYRMFERWRQENFFKCMREEYALDALAEHAVVPDAPDREVPNPAWGALNAQLHQAQAHMDRLQAEYGLEALTNPELQRPTMRGFKIAQGKLSQKIFAAWQRIQQLEKRRAAIPKRVPVQTITQEPIVKLAPERKHLTNMIKMVAYQAESALFRLVASHYQRAEDEGRTLIQSALASAADLEATQNELRVTLAPQSSPHRTRDIAGLCEELNQTETIFPSSRLRLRYAIRGAS